MNSFGVALCAFLGILGYLISGPKMCLGFVAAGILLSLWANLRKR